MNYFFEFSLHRRLNVLKNILSNCFGKIIQMRLVVFWISMNCIVKYYKLKPIAHKCCYQQRNEKKFVKCQFPICKLFYQSVKSFILLWWKMHFITSYPILGTTFFTNKSTLHWLQRIAKCAYNNAEFQFISWSHELISQKMYFYKRFWPVELKTQQVAFEFQFDTIFFKTFSLWLLINPEKYFLN